MMNQKRQARNDQLRNEMESDVNVKADLEITQLHDKIDKISSRDIADLKKQIGQMNCLLEKLTAQHTNQHTAKRGQ